MSESIAVAQARGISVSFGGVKALVDVDLAIPSHSVVGLVGPNGAGKTTLLGVLSGLTRPSSGTVTVGGADVTGKVPQEFARRGVARTFQHAGLFAEVTVRDHLVLARRIVHRHHHVLTDILGLGFGPRSADENDTVDEVMRMLGLESCARRLPSEIPLGTRRLVEVAQALLFEPKLLLLDEPSAGLDTAETQAFGRVLAQARERYGFSVLLVEHDLDFVLSISTLLYVLDFGHIIGVGAPREVLASADVRRAYLGSSSAAVPA
ncbi:MAG TPA: ATP-binding cassette domain-containing protein [Candidatus Dormibacteraeota bacterium]|jgi:ABC-type branched-subunit amino acid transport system ATPase component|nr:ATP-binding cassette domain-containing protein [Candidatus Dormibacteraeota bacterium]